MRVSMKSHVCKGVTVKVLWCSVLLVVGCHGASPACAAEAPVLPLSEMLGPRLVQADGKSVPVATLQGKVVGVYFAARNDLASYKFHEWLLRLRNRAVAAGQPFEVVFVSHDASAAEMTSHMKDCKMTWPAVPYDRARIQKLDATFRVGTLPVLAVLNAQGEVVATNAVKMVLSAGSKAIEVWQKAKPVRLP